MQMTLSFLKMSKLNTFYEFSGLKPNNTKCEIAGIGVLNGVQVAHCGMKCVNLNNEAMKYFVFILRIIKILSKIKNFANILSK